MNKHLIIMTVLVFILGWLGNNVYSEVYKDISSYDLSLGTDQTGSLADSIKINLKEQDSPYDRIKESQIHVFDDNIIIDLDNPEWSTFTDTNSMDPVIDKGANAIHIVPEKEDEIHVGDIVAYESMYTSGTVIHRVIEVGEDDEGIFFILKGDNNPRPDPGKVRFDQIQRVLVAIIY